MRQHRHRSPKMSVPLRTTSPSRYSTLTAVPCRIGPVAEVQILIPKNVGPSTHDKGYDLRDGGDCMLCAVTLFDERESFVICVGHPHVYGVLLVDYSVMTMSLMYIVNHLHSYKLGGTFVEA